MLIVGDVATKKYKNDTKIKEVEVLYHDKEELKYIENKFNILQNLNPDFKYQAIFNNGILYKFYNSNLGLIYRKILKDTFGNKYVVKVAPPFVNFLFTALKVRTVHNNFSNWLHYMESYTFLQNTYIEALVRHDNTFNSKIKKYFGLLTSLQHLDGNTKSMPYKYTKYTASLDMEDLLAVTTEYSNIKNSSLYIISDIEQEKFNESIFDSLNYEEQLEACAELLYIDILHEYVIPLLIDFKIQADEKELEKREFPKAIMHRASQDKDSWLGNFMINNFNELKEKYNSFYFITFLEAIAMGELYINDYY